MGGEGVTITVDHIQTADDEKAAALLASLVANHALDDGKIAPRLAGWTLAE